MNIEPCYPLFGKQRRQYGELLDALRKYPEVWLSLNPEEIAGANNRDKQSAIRQACSRAGLKVETSARSGGLYVKTMKEGGLTR